MPSMPGVIDQLLPGGAARAGHEVENALGEDLVAQLGELRSHERRVRGWLEDDRVARDERRARGAAGEREREVERRDDGEDAEWAQHAVVVLVGPQRLHRLEVAVVLRELVAVVLDEVRCFDDVPQALEPVLADLVDHQRREVVLLGADGVAQLLQEAHPLLPGGRGPAGRGRLRRSNRLLDVLWASLLELAEQDPGVDRAAIVELFARRDRFAADVHRVGLPECALHAFDRCVELDVQVRVSRHRRVGNPLLRCH